MESIDGYLEAVPPRTRAALKSLRKAIKAAAPKADEVISYRVPSFKYHGMLVGFAAFREHCSFFLMSTTVMEAHKDELKRYDTSAGTIRFTADAPLPAALVTKLVKARIKENMSRAAK
ncbi:MAG TPA: DUF1801 domain-containing protein [Candidatus Polarisedimenticolia bacterium]|nr:DUF1801 domain-containing protein [Candidatus Polarisedimenticolia bacterium]